MTASRFELTSRRQKVSRLPTEPPGRPAYILYDVVCNYVEPNNVLVAEDDDTTSVVLLCRRQGEEHHEKTYGMRNRQRNVYDSLKCRCFGLAA